MITASAFAQPAEPAPATGPAPAPAAPAAQQPGGQATGGFELGLGGSGDAISDTGPGDEPNEPGKPKPLPWSLQLVWDQSATTDTVGVGQDRQSEDPTYDMTFTLKPAYKLISKEKWSLSIAGEIGALREFTNSDTTTNRGEWTLTDAKLFSAYNRVLASDGDMATTVGLSLPVLTFPTSKISANTGRILGLGASASLGQTVPVLGSGADALQTFTLTGIAGYNHTFTQATTPVNGDFERSRITPSGQTDVSDQLSTGYMPKHQASLTLAGTLGITKTISWTNSFSWRPTWKYDAVEVDCVNVTTPGDCAEVTSAEKDPTNFSVVTIFASEVGMQVVPEFSFAVGYANGTLQLGEDGTRRNILYSPDARVYLSLVGHIDAIYDSLSGRRESQKSQTAQKKPVQTASR
ncbi:MAG: hypothetical protein KC766_38850 [Myxococcales bacterium]|nr:hypothetical protein [Myxococcales bacterium]